MFLLLLFLATLAFYWFYWRLRHLPPGPIPWPIVGNLREIIYGHEHPDFMGAWLHWKKIYGPIFTVHFSSEPVVVITDFQFINELIVKNAETFRGRWFFEPIFKQMEATGGLNGIFRNPRDSWQIVRRFTLHKLRDLGMGRPRLEEKCIEYLNRIEERILCEKRHSWDAGEIVDLFHGSTLNFLVFGKNFLTTACIGESLTRMELFLFAANFFHKFEVYAENPLEPPTSKKVPSVTAHPAPFRIRLEPRKVL